MGTAEAHYRLEQKSFKNMKTLFYLKEALHILLTALTYTILPVIVFTMLTSRTHLVPGISSYTVLTGSMEPLIQTGSIVFVQKSEDFRPGDIISFEAGKINITHRIVAVVNEKGEKTTTLASPLSKYSKPPQIFYQTKGDANDTADNQPVAQNKVIGKAMFHLPYVGIMIAFLRSIPGFLLFIVLPTLGFILFELWNIKNEIVKQTEQRVYDRLKPYYG